MLALFANRPFRPSAATNSVEFALDLTSDAITLFERSAHGDWKKFASVQLDDPEFPIVIGLLRTEAESHSGERRPVRLWLPGEQVLRLRARIEGKTQAERLKATLDYIDRETVYRPKDVAVAIAPADAQGETTVLITFAETWREARDYATRWGFMLGDVSTRHNARDFGSNGPVFQVQAPQRKPETPAKPKRLMAVALALIAITAVSSVLALRPWEPRSEYPYSATTAAGNVAEAPSISKPHPLKPELLLEHGLEKFSKGLQPEQLSKILDLASSRDPEVETTVGSTSIVFKVPKLPDAPIAPAANGAVPLPLPVLEPVRQKRDLAAASIDPVPAMQSSDSASLLAAMETSKLMEPPIRIENVNLLISGKAPPPEIPATPVIDQLPAPSIPVAFPVAAEATEPPAGAHAPYPVPVPAPRSALIIPNIDKNEIVPLQRSAMVIPPPRPPGRGKSVTEIAIEPTPAAPSVAAPSVAVSIAPAEVQTLDDPTKFASLTSPRPTKRPVLPARSRELTSVTTLPGIAGTTQRSIWEAATEQGLPLDQTALIGILNLDTGRKALLRLPNGRYRSVVVGDELDGWRVSVIGTDAMRVTRAGQDQTLLLVNR